MAALSFLACLLSCRCLLLCLNSFRGRRRRLLHTTVVSFLKGLMTSWIIARQPRRSQFDRAPPAVRRARDASVSVSQNADFLQAIARTNIQLVPFVAIGRRDATSMCLTSPAGYAGNERGLVTLAVKVRALLFELSASYNQLTHSSSDCQCSESSRWAW